MKAILLAAALCGPLAALAGPDTAQARDEPGFQARLYERYCAKLREGPQAYGQFVNRMRTVHGYAANDFATVEGNAPVRAACREEQQRLASASQGQAPPPEKATR
jgi:hypothetical protein